MKPTNPSNKHARGWFIAGVTVVLMAVLWFCIQPTHRQHTIGGPQAMAASASPAPEAKTKFAMTASETDESEAAEATPDSTPKPVQQIELIASAWDKDSDAKLAAFSIWAKDYIAAPADQKAQMVEQGVALAKERSERLSELIENDPERALANAVPMAVRNQMPAEILAQLEHRLSGYGDLTRISPVIDDSGRGGAPFTYAEVGGEHYLAYTYGTRGTLASLKGAPIHGISIDEKLAVLDNGIRRVEAGEDVSGKVINKFCAVSGSINTTVGAGIVSDDSTAPFQIGNQLFGTCSPDHAENIADGIRRNELLGNELLAKNQDGLTFKDLQKLNELHIMAYGGASGTAWPGMPGTGITTGTKRVLVMLVTPRGWSVPPWSQSYARDVMIGNNCTECWGQPTRSVANQLYDFSFGKLNVSTVDVTPNMTLPKTRDEYIQDYWGPILNDSKAAAAALGYNTANYDWFVVAHAGLDWGGACGWGGDGNVWCNGCYGAGLLEHELGHGIRLPHANGWYITSNNPWDASRTHWEYYDCTDPMGNGNRSPANHYGAFYKYWLGWIPQSDVINVTSSGTYRIYQFDQRTANLNNPMALLFRRGTSASSYWVSFRGSDALGNFANAAQIHEVVDNAGDTHLLDFNNPNPDTDPDDNCNGGLTINQTYTDTVGNLTIKTIGTGGSVPNRYMDFQVTFGAGNASYKTYESYNYSTYFIRHYQYRGRIDPNVSPAQDKQFYERAGLNGVSGTISLESANFPGYYLRHRSDGTVWLDQNDGTSAFKASATWYKRAGLANSGASSFEAYSNPGTYLRHRSFVLYREAVSAGTGYSDATFWTR